MQTLTQRLANPTRFMELSARLLPWISAAAAITDVRAVFADFDDGIPAPERFALPPSMIVGTSPGKAQYYWLVSDDMSDDQFKGIMARLVKDYGADEGAKDKARVLHVPGFMHTKGEPTPVKLLFPEPGEPEKRYSTRRLLEAFPPIQSEQKKAPPTILTNFNKVFAGSNSSFDAEKVTDALAHIPNSAREDWLEVGMALYHGTHGSEEAYEIWSDWARSSAKFNEDDQRSTWRSFTAENYDGAVIGLGTLFKLAKDNGYEPAQKRDLVIVRPELVAVAKFDQSALAWGMEKCREKAESKDTWTPEEQGELLTRMNADHAFVDVGGKMLVTKTEVSPLLGSSIVFMSAEAMRQKYGAVILGGSENRPVTAYQKWERWPGRRQYEGVGMFPGSSVNPSKAPKNYLNLWGGLQITPAKGDWSRVKNHMLMMCGGNEEHLNWLLDWNAQLIQEPQGKRGAAVVFKSSQKGAGKSMFAGFWLKIFGAQHVAIVTSSDQITGRFNAISGQSVLVFLEEASWGGSKQAGNALKERITGTMTTIERKGLDPFVQQNFTRYWFNSNEEWIAPVGTGERRYFIADFVSPHANDPSYFEPLFQQMRHEGGIEAMAHELLNRKITSNLYDPPKTKGLENQRGESLSGIERFIFETAQSGQVPRENEPSGYGCHELKDERVMIPSSAVRSAAYSHCDNHEARALDIRLAQILSEVGVTKTRKRDRSGTQKYVYLFPPHEEFVALASKRLSLPIELIETI